MTELFQNHIFSLLAILIGLSGFIFAVFAFTKNRRLKSAKFYSKTTELIKKPSFLNKLEIKYDDKVLQKLYVTKIAFYNSGNITIDKSDLVDSHPLQIGFINDISVLDTSIVYCREDACAIKIIGNKIEFEYLDGGHGAVIQVVHEEQNTPVNTQLHGVIKGIKNINSKKNNKRMISIIYYISGLVIFMSFLILSLESIPKTWKYGDTVKKTLPWLGIIAGILVEAYKDKFVDSFSDKNLKHYLNKI